MATKNGSRVGIPYSGVECIDFGAYSMRSIYTGKHLRKIERETERENEFSSLP